MAPTGRSATLALLRKLLASKGNAVMDAEVVCLMKRGVADFDMLHSRTADHLAVACAFDLLRHDGDDLTTPAVS